MAGKQVLVPLTSSLYVPGKLSDVEHVVVDVGTGYYIKKVGCRVLTVGMQADQVDKGRSDIALRVQIDVCARKPRDAAKDHREETGQLAERGAGFADEDATGTGTSCSIGTAR